MPAQALPESLMAELERMARSRGYRQAAEVLAEAPATPRPKVAPVEGVKGAQPWWNRD